MKANIAAILLTLVIGQAHGQGPAEHFMDGLFDRALKAEPLDADLDDTAMAKTATHLAMPSAQAPPVAVRPRSPSLMRTPPTASHPSMLSQGLVHIPHASARSSFRDVAVAAARDRDVAAEAAKGRDVAASAAIGPFTSPEHETKWTRERGTDVEFTYEEVSSKEAAEMMKHGWTLLDVRPPEQVEKTAVKGAVEVPLYVIENDKSPKGLYREALTFGLGGWWMGARPMKENPDFLSQVKQKGVGPNTKVIVACQEGLRSEQAIKDLHKAGYTNLAHIKGGFIVAKKGTLPVVPEGADIRMAGARNVAGMLGFKNSR